MAPTLLAVLATLGAAVGGLRVTLLHTNDMHARFEPTDRYCGACANTSSTACYGGFARLRAEVTSQRQRAAAAGRSVVFLNAGDTYQGTPYYTFFKWPIVSKFVNMLGFDVMSLGNHEFDDGPAGLAPFIASSNTPIVCANLDVSKEPGLQNSNLTPSKVITVNGTKIGVIGYLTPDTVNISDTGKVKIFEEIPYIRAEAQKLKSQGISILIGLGHSGYAIDQLIAQEVEELDLVVGGHTHTFLYTGPPPDVDTPLGPYPTTVTQVSGKKVPVVQAFYATKYLGYLELDFDDQGNLKNYSGLPILLSGNISQDPTIVEALKPYSQNISREVDRIVGYSSVFLNNTGCRLGECNLGNLVADAYVDWAVHTFPSTGWTIAAIGIVQAGAMRASINTRTNIYHNGSITLEDVMMVMPFSNKILATNVTGDTIKAALEYSVARYEYTMTAHVNEFLQVSGLKVVYDMRRPSGQRVVSVMALCADCVVPVYRPLVGNKTYGLALSDYLTQGGDGFTQFNDIHSRLYYEPVDYELISKYMEKHSPLHPAIEGRITIIEGSPSSAAAPYSSLLPICIPLIYFICCSII